MSKMGINLLACWFYGVDNEPFVNLLDQLNVKNCHCIYLGEETNNLDKRISLYNVCNPLSHYLDDEIDIELDDYIIEKMKPYEQTCLDIIYRWRRSYSNKSTYAEMKRIYFSLLRYWNNFIVSNEIDLFIVNLIPHCVDEYIPYALCKAHGIPTIVQGIIPFTKGEKTNYILRPGVDEFDANLGKRYELTQKKYKDNNQQIDIMPELRRYFDQYVDKSAKSQKVVFFNEKNSIIEKLDNLKTHALKYINRKEYNLLFNKFLYMTRIGIETGRFLRKVVKLEENADKSKDFMLFCLHLQPEATTTPAGGNFADQLVAIRLISECLPENLYLYVKEHPAYWSQKGRLESVYESRNIEFYQNIKKLKNVILVDHNIPSGELLTKCKAVVTINGTVGFEALFSGIPVLTFASTFYEEHPSVFRIRDKADCQLAISKITSETFEYDARSIEFLLAAVQKYVVPMGMREKNFLDNGAPEVNDDDMYLLGSKLVEFYREYYEDMVEDSYT